MKESPFMLHRDKVMGHHSAAAWLRTVVLAMGGESAEKACLSALSAIDANHFRAFADMTAHFHQRGVNDPALHALVQEIRERQEEEREANARAERLERWCLATKLRLRERGLEPGSLDDRYNWFESLFDQGKSPEDAAGMAVSGIHA